MTNAYRRLSEITLILVALDPEDRREVGVAEYVRRGLDGDKGLIRAVEERYGRRVHVSSAM